LIQIVPFVETEFTQPPRELLKLTYVSHVSSAAPV
jgi:hypothetical protein